jgi:hypothetical protein
MHYDGVLPPFLDEELEVMNLLEAYFTSLGEAVYTGDQTPNDKRLAEVLPFIRVGRVGGAPVRGDEHTDRPVVDIDVLAGTRADAKRIAKLVEQFLMSRPKPIDDCNVLMSPQRVPWVEGVSGIVRMYASYHLSFRR